MYLLNYNDQNQIPHFRRVPTSTEYISLLLARFWAQGFNVKMQLLKDGPPFITIGPSLISCFHVRVRLSVTYKGSVWGVWQLDAIYHQLQMQVLLMVGATDICGLCLSAPLLANSVLTSLPLQPLHQR